jgi:hypothetical protein
VRDGCLVNSMYVRYKYTIEREQRWKVVWQ